MKEEVVFSGNGWFLWPAPEGAKCSYCRAPAVFAKALNAFLHHPARFYCAACAEPVIVLETLAR